MTRLRLRERVVVFRVGKPMKKDQKREKSGLRLYKFLFVICATFTVCASKVALEVHKRAWS